MSARIDAHRWLRIAGATMATIGAAMAAMPFVGAAMGVAFDAYGATDINRNRMLLHVLPGLAALALGVAIYRAARKTVDGGMPSWLPAAAGGALFVSVWMGAGPWILDAILPQSDNGLMFLGIPGFGEMTKAEQMALESACHWLPGMAALITTWIATVVVRKQQPSRRSAGAAA